MRQTPIALLLTTALLPACGRTTTEPAPVAATETAAESRKYLLEQIDDAGVIQLYADGFAALPLREKTLIYHLSRAAIAGRNIFYDQKHRNALEKDFPMFSQPMTHQAFIHLLTSEESFELAGKAYE